MGPINRLCFSAYCMTEFEMAYHHNVAVKRKKRLIAVMALDNLSDLGAVNNVTDTTMLRQFLGQYTYIDYSTDDWLDRLLYALPLHGLLHASDDRMMAELDPHDDVPLYPDIQA